MNPINTIILGVTGLGIVASMAFDPFTAYSNILGPLGMILVLGPHISKH